MPEALAALHARCFTVPRPWSTAEFADLVAAPGVFLLTDGQGFALGRIVADEAELLTLAVVPETRRQGTGRALMARFDAAARAGGADHAFLEVAADNAAARALYARCGWAEAGRRPRYYATGDGRAVDALILTKFLGPS